jgi:hypothetical protein
MIEHDSLPFTQFAGLTYDQWMIVSAGSGMVIIFLSLFFTLSGWVHAESLAPKIGRRVGYVLIGIPLFSRWFLSSSLLFSLGVCIVFISVIKLFLLRKGV